MVDTRHYAALLSTFLLAAGCGELAYEDYVEEKGAIECEIREACGEDIETCWASSTGDELGSCRWFRPQRGQRCLIAMDEALESAYDNPQTCEAWQGGQNPLSQCEDDEVTRRRRGFSCFVSNVAGGGRPIREAGAPVLAPLIAIGGQATVVPCLQRAAAGWLELARYEHASIAAFSRAATELMHLGAPTSLVRRCHQAALDEARHADLTLRVATTLGGTRHRFGRLPLTHAPLRSLREVAVDALFEGCWGEGTAAIAARVGASRSRGEVAQVLNTIALDETRHAELAWSTVRWAVEQQPDLLADLRAAVATALSRERGATEPSEGDRELEPYGLVGRAQMRSLAREVLERLVAPVLAAMAGTQRPHAAQS